MMKSLLETMKTKNDQGKLKDPLSLWFLEDGSLRLQCVRCGSLLTDEDEEEQALFSGTNNPNTQGYCTSCLNRTINRKTSSSQAKHPD